MPFVETLESYSRALYLPLRGYVRRPFLFVTESIREHVPGSLLDMRKTVEHTILGSSRFLGLSDDLSNNASSTSARSGSSGPNSRVGSGQNNAGFAATTGGKNTISAIATPRNRHPLKLSVRFAIKLPALYLLMKSALITLSLLIEDHSAMPMAWMISEIKATYNESQALWLSFIAMGVSCITDSFISNLQSSGPNEQTVNMLEWAILFHFTPFGKDVLIISVIEVCQQLTLQFLSLLTRGRNYRLMATTLWGILDLIHFTYAVYHRSNTYPSLQVLTRLPMVVVIMMICISLALHALTYIVTGGNVRRQIFDPHAMPSRDEEYGLAVFKLGRACLEATRGAGFRNEVDSVVLPFGTILDTKQTTKTRPSSTSTAGGSSQGQRRGQPWGSRLFSAGVAHASRAPPSGFSNEMMDVVETPAQREQISRRRSRIDVMKAFYQSSASLMVEVADRVYTKIVPARFRREPRGPLATTTTTTTTLGSRMPTQEYIQLKTFENALEQARDLAFQEEQHRRETLNEEEEEELYNNFLSRELTASDDEDEMYDIDYMLQEETDDEKEEFECVGDDSAESEQETALEEIGSYGLQRHRYCRGNSDLESSTDNGISEQSSRWRSLGSFQDFILDTSFMSIFLSGRLQDTPLTRFQYRLAMSGAREFHQDIIEYDGGEGSRGGSSSKGRFSQTKKKSSNEPDTRALLAVLNRHRKSFEDQSTSSTASTDSSRNIPPPLAKYFAEDGSIHSRLLCVVCQSEPRGVLLRPCRCLALCNECREVLASRTLKLT
ncbi:hypothetical protein BGZ65_005492 [Modicella reniformis]|uniref:Uncharacterized protein n=1 Tax=Modicella reniformis TaxID=1440133 RepID=A0A9P6SQ89_9FUNG|nr:hypothetical protein BGZ65_005492 [Modicella reniformis]